MINGVKKSVPYEKATIGVIEKSRYHNVQSRRKRRDDVKQNNTPENLITLWASGHASYGGRKTSLIRKNKPVDPVAS